MLKMPQLVLNRSVNIISPTFFLIITYVFFSHNSFNYKNLNIKAQIPGSITLYQIADANGSAFDHPGAQAAPMQEALTDAFLRHGLQMGAGFT